VRDRWNHNIEYHRVVHEAIDGVSGAVLDVGTGEGTLAAELAGRGVSVTAIDLDRPSIETARAGPHGTDVEFVVGDFVTHPFPPASFDAVVSVAALHHMDEAMALSRMAELVTPGGTVAVVGLARSEVPRDLGWQLAGAATTRVLKWRRGGYWETASPKVWPPPSTYRQIERTAAGVLPGVRYRRHVLWRYSLVWEKPSG
jgi:2-polyprenyl-3-methyl-5-hydroxy-6-metoxy-1,4-benzoquinol methylase